MWWIVLTLIYQDLMSWIWWLIMSLNLALFFFLSCWLSLWQNSGSLHCCPLKFFLCKPNIFKLFRIYWDKISRTGRCVLKNSLLSASRDYHLVDWWEFQFYNLGAVLNGMCWCFLYIISVATIHDFIWAHSWAFCNCPKHSILLTKNLCCAGLGHLITHVM